MSTPLVTRVSVIVPCRNERGHIEVFLRCMDEQEREGHDFEFLVADGMSDDGTRDVLIQHAARHREYRLIDNPAGTVSTGLNLAVRAARGDVIVRCDVHTEYAPDYIRRCVDVLFETGADNVGGPARTRAEGYLQQAVALAYHSPFSTGGAKFHDPCYEGDVDTVTYGCWRKARLIELGIFDEELVRNQDDELNLRILRAGGRVYQAPSIRSWYRPRASLAELFRQYMQYGYWKVRVIQKHRVPASVRHLAPGAFVGGLSLFAVLAPFSKAAGVGALVMAGTYAAANLAMSFLMCVKGRQLRALFVMPAVLAAFHFGYGCGFLRGLVDFGLLRRSASSAFRTPTRRPLAP